MIQQTCHRTTDPTLSLLITTEWMQLYWVVFKLYQFRYHCILQVDLAWASVAGGDWWQSICGVLLFVDSCSKSCCHLGCLHFKGKMLYLEYLTQYVVSNMAVFNVVCHPCSYLKQHSRTFVLFRHKNCCIWWCIQNTKVFIHVVSRILCFTVVLMLMRTADYQRYMKD